MNELDKQRREALRGLALGHIQSADNQFKWIVGTLVILNGGALLALVNIQKFEAEVFGSTGWAFIASIVLALVSGLLYADSRSYAAQRCLYESWSIEPIADDVNAILNDDRVNRYYIGAATVLFVAIGVFILGVFMASLLPTVIQQNQLSVAIERNKARVNASSEALDRLSQTDDQVAQNAAFEEANAAIEEFNQLSANVEALVDQ